MTDRGRHEFTYYPGMVRVPEASAPDVKNKSYSVTADVSIPNRGAEGVIVTRAGRFAGWGLRSVGAIGSRQTSQRKQDQ